MGDLKVLYTAAIIAVLASVFVATMFAQSIQNANNSGLEPNGDQMLPLQNQTTSYLSTINSTTQTFTTATNASFSSNPFVSALNTVSAGLTTGFASISIIMNGLLLLAGIVAELFSSPILAIIGIPVLTIGSIALAWVVGNILLTIFGVVQKWFT